MTYMSIPKGIAALVERGQLHCLPSAIIGFDTVRELYVSPAIMEVVAGPFAYDGSDDHFIEFRAHLDAFLEGAIFTAAEQPHNKPPETMLARVDPVHYELWDLRNVAPHPGIRCFGGFWERDVFIALRWEYREHVDWDTEIEDCRADWAALFGARPPMSGAKLNDYLTNFDAV